MFRCSTSICQVRHVSITIATRTDVLTVLRFAQVWLMASGETSCALALEVAAGRCVRCVLALPCSLVCLAVVVTRSHATLSLTTSGTRAHVPTTNRRLGQSLFLDSPLYFFPLGHLMCLPFNGKRTQRLISFPRHTNILPACLPTSILLCPLPRIDFDWHECSLSPPCVVCLLLYIRDPEGFFFL